MKKIIVVPGRIINVVGKPVDEKGRPIICTTCQGSGYYERTGVFELLLITPEIRQAVETLLKTEVVEVKTLNVMGKSRRMAATSRLVPQSKNWTSKP